MSDQKVKDYEDLTVKIKNEILTLKITAGFWKRCGFKREETKIIESDPEIYLKALKLAVYYGNKERFNWDSIQDLEQMFSDDDFEDTDVDYAAKLSYAMVYFMPINLRKIILKQLAEADSQMEETINSALVADEEPPVVTNETDEEENGEKKN